MVYICTCVYIYISREREIDICVYISIYIYICIYTHMYIYIYIYCGERTKCNVFIVLCLFVLCLVMFVTDQCICCFNAAVCSASCCVLQVLPAASERIKLEQLQAVVAAPRRWAVSGSCGRAIVGAPWRGSASAVVGVSVSSCCIAATSVKVSEIQNLSTEICRRDLLILLLEPN